jgi:hypothetical protein
LALVVLLVFLPVDLMAAILYLAPLPQRVEVAVVEEITQQIAMD